MDPAAGPAPPPRCRPITFTGIDRRAGAAEVVPFVPLSAGDGGGPPPMRKGGAVVVGEPVVHLWFDYPCSKWGPSRLEQRRRGWRFAAAAPNGAHFTRRDLAWAVISRYRAIYAEEAATATVPARPISRTFRNRRQTDGRYGIFGHGLDDLLLLFVVYDRRVGAYRVCVES